MSEFNKDTEIGKIFNELFDKDENTNLSLDQPAPYNLNWRTFEVKFDGGRSHIFNKPAPEKVVEWDESNISETSFTRDGKPKMSSDEAQEKTLTANSQFYDQFISEYKGYKNEPTSFHKSKAVEKLYDHLIYLKDGQDIFDEEVTIIELIGDEDNPLAIIEHTFSQPEEKLLRKMNAAINNRKPEHEKRGRMKLVEVPWIRKAMAFYGQCLVRISGAVVGDQSFSPEIRQTFIQNIDPLIQKRIVSYFVGRLTGALQD